MYRFIALFCSLILMGCSHFHMYQPTVEQGNVMTDEMISQLHTGMTQNQVEEVMGSPVLKNILNDDRVNYVYTFKPGAGKMTQKRLTLIFQKGKLSRIEKDF